MDPLSLIGNIIQLISAVDKMKTNVVSFRAEAETFCSLLDVVRSILQDVQTVLKRKDGMGGRFHEHQSKLHVPLRGIYDSVSKGRNILDMCRQKTRLQVYIFSEDYLRELRVAANYISNNLQTLQAVGIVLQVDTSDKIRKISNIVAEFNSKIDRHHNKLKEIIASKDDSADRRFKELELLMRMALVANGKDLREQARDIAENADELRTVKVDVEGAMLKWVLNASHIPESIICPISLAVMEDPVIVVESGITYDHKSLCSSLLEHPDLEPVTRQRYDVMITYTFNIAIRQILMNQFSDRAYKKYKGAATFKTQYQKAWNEKVVGMHSKISIADTGGAAEDEMEKPNNELGEFSDQGGGGEDEMVKVTDELGEFSDQLDQDSKETVGVSHGDDGVNNDEPEPYRFTKTTTYMVVLFVMLTISAIGVTVSAVLV